MKKQTARIEDWYLYMGRLYGRVVDHPRQNEFLHERQATSLVISFDPENNRAETLNTIYELGAPYVSA